MKILLDLQGCQSESRYRGIGRYSRSLAKAMIARGGSHDIGIVFNASLRPADNEAMSEFAQLLPAERILHFTLPTPVAEHDTNNGWRARAAELIRESAIASFQPDMVHVSSLFEGFVDDSVTSIGRMNVMHSVSNTLYDLIPLKDPNQYLSTESYRRYYLRKAQSLKRSDLLLSISAYSKREAEQLLNIPSEKITVIGAGVDPAFHKSIFNKEIELAVKARLNLPNRFILHVGALDPRKNPDVLIEAFAKLRSNQAKDCKLVFAGHLSPDEEGRVRVIAGRFGLPSSDMIFPGHVTDQELVALYHMCEVLVFPSLHEGFGLPAAEAMACGAAVLVADNTSLPEVVGRTESLFDPRSSADLAAKLSVLLTDENLRTDLQRFGPGQAARFTWDESARLGLEAFEDAVERRPHVPTRMPNACRKPKLAFVSPLPGDKTGIADYSTNLLIELARFYDVECIIEPSTVVTDEWVLSNFPRRDYDWLIRNEQFYDRVIYSVGNSSFHGRMLELLPIVPGVTILHDVFLSNLIEWLCGTEQWSWSALDREIYLSHGLSGLYVKARSGVRAAIDQLPMCGPVVRNSLGIIVHSEHAMSLITNSFGEAMRSRIAVVPQLRPTLVQSGDRAKVRKTLGILPNDFVVCSFGLATHNKLIHEIVSAWSDLGFSERADCRLIVVGDIGGDITVSEREKLFGSNGTNVKATGRVSNEVFENYLFAADVAVQLRKNSRGETSRAILDCMAAGLPVIVNAHGSAAELPEDCVVLIPDEFSVQQLADALSSLRSSAGTRQQLGKNARAYIQSMRNPYAAAAAVFEVVERSYRESSAATIRELLPSIANINALVSPTSNDLEAVASCVASIEPATACRQILYDVSVIAEKDAHTGIQRVVRAVLQQLISNYSKEFRIEPVLISGTELRYARSFISGRLGLATGELTNDLVETRPDDIYLSVDWVPDRLPNLAPWLKSFRNRGGRVSIVVHDLLPLDLPGFFPPGMDELMRRWFEVVLTTADSIACVSRSVADDVARYANATDLLLPHPISIGYFHHGYDLSGSIPTTGITPSEETILRGIGNRRPFLMVGTVEPRKGHQQVLDAFKLLWRDGVDVGLTIVGKQGWMMNDLSDAIVRCAELEDRLIWLQNISDEMLERVYMASCGLIVASRGEGFGLPIIEASAHNLPVIARDLPVFREVAGSSAMYFSGSEPEDLAAAIKDWLQAADAKMLPDPQALRIQTWAEATAQLMDVVLGRACVHTIRATALNN